MTENQAHEKWCPHSRTLTVYKDGLKSNSTPNRIYTSPQDGETWDGRNIWLRGSGCVASSCMMWRWMKSFGEDGEVIYSDVDGYCGLAGQGS